MVSEAGSHHIDRGQNRLHAGDVAPLGTPAGEANLQVYGAEKVWRQLRREGTNVARRTMELPVRKAGLHGVMRGKVVRTTTADAKAP